MSTWVASAPGKVVLLGEYAVLDGAPALVQAVNRRCTVRLSLCAQDHARIEAVQLGNAIIRFALDELGQPRWKDGFPPGFERTAAVIESVLKYGQEQGAIIRPFAMRIDSGPLFSGSTKLGLGSSGAVTVAVDAALRAAFLDHKAGDAGDELPRQTVARLRAAAGSARRAAGSGIDLAASLCGGMLEFRLVGSQVELEPVQLPHDLSLFYVWAGKPASTCELLAAWRQAAKTRPDEHRRLLEAMKTLAEKGRQAAQRADAAALMGAMAGYGRIMSKMNRLTGHEIVTAGHRRAAAVVSELGGVYKPCGAGGGDIGVAAFSRPGPAASLRSRLPESVLTDLKPDRRGVYVKRE